MDSKQQLELLERFHAQNPHPTTELRFQSDFELLIAVILSAQATDKSVNKATDNLFKVADTPEKILALGLEGLKHYIRTIGLYNSKANNIIKTCQLIEDRFSGRVPNNRLDLESLPGVGRKTANVILNTAFDYDTIAVDTHIFRVSNRTGLAKGKTPLAVENTLLKVIPKQFRKDAHHWLVLHGRYTCTARRPKCPTCIIRDLCEYPQKTVEPMKETSNAIKKKIE